MKKIRLWLENRIYPRMAKLLVHSNTNLTPKYLQLNGWTFNPKTYEWTEVCVKDRDKVTIKFSGPGPSYLVYHGKNLTFISRQRSLEWFKMYMLLLDSEKQYKLAGL